MILLLALPVIAAVALAHRCLMLYAPSNVLICRRRASQPRVRTVAAVLAVAAAALVAMKVVADAVVAGAPGWLNLVVLVLAWDAIKMGWLAMVEIGTLLACGARRCSPSKTLPGPASPLG